MGVGVHYLRSGIGETTVDSEFCNLPDVSSSPLALSVRWGSPLWMWGGHRARERKNEDHALGTGQE